MSILSNILLNSVFIFYANRMGNLASLVSVGENVIVNFPGLQFRAKDASIML